jgi:hypothetical protein
MNPLLIDGALLTREFSRLVLAAGGLVLVLLVIVQWTRTATRTDGGGSDD